MTYKVFFEEYLIDNKCPYCGTILVNDVCPSDKIRFREARRRLRNEGRLKDG